MSIRIHLPSDIGEVAGYLPSKGFMDLEVEAHGHKHRLSFREVANVQAGVRGAREAGLVDWWEPGLVVLTEVSVENIKVASKGAADRARPARLSWDRLHAAVMSRATSGVRSVDDDLKIKAAN